MKLDAEEIVQTVRGLTKNAKKKVIDEAPEAIPEAGDWREVMHQTILALDPREVGSLLRTSRRQN